RAFVEALAGGTTPSAAAPTPLSGPARASGATGVRAAPAGTAGKSVPAPQAEALPPTMTDPRARRPAEAQRVLCPHCGARLKVRAESRHQRVRCSACRQVFVPGIDPVRPGPPPPQPPSLTDIVPVPRSPAARPWFGFGLQALLSVLLL